MKSLLLAALLIFGVPAQADAPQITAIYGLFVCGDAAGVIMVDSTGASRLYDASVEVLEVIKKLPVEIRYRVNLTPAAGCPQGT